MVAMHEHGRRLTLLLILGAAVAATGAPHAVAQRPMRSRVEALTATAAMKRVFSDVVRPANACTAKVFVGDRQVALATVVAADGWLVTKASELARASAATGAPPGAGAAEVTVEIGGERRVAARYGVDDVSDLALLHVPAQGLTVAPWRDEAPAAGAWLATPDGSEVPCGIGILSAAPYRHSQQRGYRGVQMHRDGGVARVETVQPDSAAAAAGLQPEDVILALGDEEVASFEPFIAAIGKHAPGAEVQLRVRRGEKELHLSARLRSDRRGPRNDQERIWGPLSEVRSGFATVLQHDTVLRPEQCGGPLVDLDGKVVGVNVARAGRVETLAIPAATVRAVVERLRAAAAKDRREQ